MILSVKVNLRVFGSAAALALTAMLVACPQRGWAAAGEPTTAATAGKAGGATAGDEQVERAVRRGLDYLYSRQSAAGAWDSPSFRMHPGAIESLIVAAALDLGEDPNRPQIQLALHFLSDANCQTVCGRALRARVFTRLNTEASRQRLQKDLEWLVKLQDARGGWGYGPGYPAPSGRANWVDNANTAVVTQALCESPAELPPPFWKSCRTYWTQSQNSDGGWGYEPPGASKSRLRPGSYGTMTAGAVASLFELIDRAAAQDRPGAEGGGRGPKGLAEPEALDHGLNWLDQNVSFDRVPGWIWSADDAWPAIYLYQLVRAASAAGADSLGGRDWVAAVASLLVAAQKEDGSWGDWDANSQSEQAKDPQAATAYVLGCLARTRQPLLLNRLAFDGPWGADCRDAANLCRYLSNWAGRGVAWESLSPATATVAQMLRAPILYIQAAKFAPDEALGPKLWQYVQAGGTIVVQCPPNVKDVADKVEAFFRGLAPDFVAGPLAPEHALFQGMEKLPAARVTGLGDAARTRVLLVLDDWSSPMHRGMTKESLPAFQYWANLAAYVSNLEPLEGPLTARHRPQGPAKTVRTVTIGLLKHGGDWNVCPFALRRLAEVLANSLSLGLEVKTLDLEQAPPASIPLLWMTGTRPPSLSPAELANLKQYLDGGGMLFIDSAAGGAEFVTAAQKLVRYLYGREPMDLAAPHPIVTGQFGGGMGADLSTLKLTWAAETQRAGDTRPPLAWVEVSGRCAIVLSRLAVTGPMEGPCYGWPGLATDDARRLGANLVLYAAFGREK